MSEALPFSLTCPPDLADNPEVRAYLAECEQRIWREIGGAEGWERLRHQVFTEMNGFGYARVDGVFGRD